MYGKILVPLDGSATAQRGFEEAVALGRALGSSLVVLHVIDTFPIAVEMITATTWQEISDGLRKHGHSLLDTACQTATTHGVKAEPHLVESRAERVADTILQQARDGGCDLIVMGTHGRRGFSHVLLGSDAERVLRESPVPVLLVRHPEARRS
ncbi:MAG: universal stress protein [Rubrivivax sp.]|nr:universal stress protein [Rubrivivax sp.]